ncbi:D-alanyl-D-alanine carboxypeptidase/D-alanyl-D-alanine endopeptidase [Piscinibacter sakaiensis]|uniref:D-alanyl-D-alanine carboxypeptidase n=1 Tax=Piscinibacter sakaiensis TaxID=1547922 RepID=A0A0K8P761_PISS1|nr:D-alanyl-D-alanine carboxypeptidase/D-alanyl-D-alanine-endopeptidase [Piscinibacter sakaiensis]GAP38498.1 D-alanyl-D-alanine carboxypeptidase [Piscinibacter sakaiensis]
MTRAWLSRPLPLPARRTAVPGRAWGAALLLATATGLAGCAATPPPPAPGRSAVLSPAAPPAGLPPAVRQALQCAGLPEEALAVLVSPRDAPATRAGDVGPRAATGGRAAAGWSHQPDRAMQPASAMKVLTSVVALERLGPAHRGSTELLSAAPLQDGRLAGDLVLRGGADPELDLPEAWALLQALRAQGVREIAGDLVLDRSLFQPERLDLGVPPFDDQPEFPYNVIPDALQFTGNLMGLVLSADDRRVTVRLEPPVDGVEIDNRLVLADELPCPRWEDGWTPPQATAGADGRVRLQLSGRFPRQCRQQQAMQLYERDLQAEHQIRWLWQGLGGQWTGRLRSGATPPGARLLARHLSRPWSELLHPVNKQSNNVYARLLYLSLGALAPVDGAPAGDTLARSAAVVDAWLDRQGIDRTGLVMDNGSGLSRRERISARQLVEALRAGLAASTGPELLASLPLAGVDGTMRNRLKGGPAQARARLKTGALRNAAAIAGVVSDRSGRDWLVAAMVNDEHGGGSAGRRVLDPLVEWIVRTGLAPGAWDEPAPACR